MKVDRGRITELRSIHSPRFCQMQMELRPSEHVPEWSRVCHVEALF